MNHVALSLVLPAYNEEKSILNTLEKAVRYFEENKLAFEIIVAADGNDNTRTIVREAYQKDPRISVIGSTQRRGKGRGIREAVQKARGNWIGFADADGKTPITEFTKFQPLLEKGIDVVIGSRAHAKKEVKATRKWYRVLGSKAFSTLMQNVVGLRGIADTQCGFKFFKNTAAKKLFSLQKIDGYMFDVEILVLAKKLGFSLEQVQVVWRDDKDTRLGLVIGNLQNIRDILKICLS